MAEPSGTAQASGAGAGAGDYLSLSQAFEPPSNNLELDDLSSPANHTTTGDLHQTPDSHQSSGKSLGPSATAAPIYDSFAAGASAVATYPEDAETAHSSAKAKGKAPATSAPDETEHDFIAPAADPEDGSSTSTAGDSLLLLLLLPTGPRHPFKLDDKYLTKRNVAVAGQTADGKPDPLSITVYTLKELILREWRKEWETPPREPVSIRLISFGKELEDKLPLSHYNLSRNNRNVLHMTVRPQEMIDEEEATKAVKSSSGNASGRRGCCVIL